MYYYWEQSESIIKIIMSSLVSKASVIRDSKKNIKTKKYDEYLIIGSGFDTESSRIKVNDELETAYVYHWAFSFDNYEIMGRSLDSFQEFFGYLLSIIPEGKKILCLVANLGFDYYFTKNRLVKYLVTKHFEKTAKNPLVVEVEEKVVFREVIGLFGKSLQHIAEQFTKTQKAVGNLDYSEVILSKTPLKDEEIVYVTDDVKILAELGRYVFKNYFGKNRTLPLTAISELRMDVKEEMGNNYFEIKNEIMSWLPDDEDDYYLFRNWLFKGGLCGTNSLLMNQHLKNIGHADFDSHYPAVMNHYLYPMGKAMRVSTEKFMSEKKPYIAVIRFSQLRSKTTHSILSLHKALDFDYSEINNREKYIIDNGRIWRANEVTFVVNDVEFMSIAQAYNFDVQSTEVIACWEFEKYGRLPYYLLNVLNRQYEKKNVLKAQGKSGTLEYMFAKNKVNGIFGMTCTALYLDEYEIDDTGEIVPKRNEDGTKYKKDYDKAIKSVFLSPYWGMWITSYARSLLINFITKFPNCVIQYDTDSIFFRTDLPESSKLVEYIEKYNKDCIAFNNELFDNNPSFVKLGTFEVDDYLLTDFKGLGSKRYMFRQFNPKEDKYEINTVVAGCRKGTIVDQFEFNTGLKAEENIDKVFDFFKDGLKIDKQHSKKLSSTYISDYYGADSIYLYYKDRDGNAERIKLESAIVLKEVEFNMGLSDAHIRFYLTVQNLYQNSPEKYSKVFEQILENYEVTE